MQINTINIINSINTINTININTSKNTLASKRARQPVIQPLILVGAASHPGRACRQVCRQAGRQETEMQMQRGRKANRTAGRKASSLDALRSLQIRLNLCAVRSAAEHHRN